MQFYSIVLRTYNPIIVSGHPSCSAQCTEGVIALGPRHSDLNKDNFGVVTRLRAASAPRVEFCYARVGRLLASLQCNSNTDQLHCNVDTERVLLDRITMALHGS